MFGVHDYKDTLDIMLISSLRDFWTGGGIRKLLGHLSNLREISIEIFTDFSTDNYL